MLHFNPLLHHQLHMSEVYVILQQPPPPPSPPPSVSHVRGICYVAAFPSVIIVHVVCLPCLSRPDITYMPPNHLHASHLYKKGQFSISMPSLTYRHSYLYLWVRDHYTYVSLPVPRASIYFIICEQPVFIIYMLSSI